MTKNSIIIYSIVCKMCVKEKIHCLLIGKSCKRSGAVVVEDLIKTNELIILGSRLMMKRELNSHPKIGKKVRRKHPSPKNHKNTNEKISIKIQQNFNMRI
jgi:hypothetical protein